MVKVALATAAAVISALVARTDGHGQMVSPVPRGDSLGRAESHEHRAPVYTLNGNRGGYSATSMRTHDFNVPGPYTTLTAGQPFQVGVKLEAAHPGDCYLYVSYDCEGTTGNCEPINFFKIAQYAGCGAPDGVTPPNAYELTATIPAQLPACDHCVLRWEWTAHQQVTNIEFYVQAAEIKIISNAGPTRPTPTVAISGIEHLPASASAYRKVYAGEGAEDRFLVGPNLATYAACTKGTPGCVGGGSGGGSTGDNGNDGGNTGGGGGGDAGPTPTQPPTDAPENCSNNVWNQCGGKTFSGSTCCPTGTYCNMQNEWYSQCIPGAAPLSVAGDEVVTPNKAGVTVGQGIGIGLGSAAGLVLAAAGFLMNKKRQQQNAIKNSVGPQQNTVANPMYHV